MSTNLLEKTIAEKLSGQSQKYALDFISFADTNEIIFTPNGDDGQGWAVGGVVGNSLGFMLIAGADGSPGEWTIWLNDCNFGDCDAADDNLKQTAWAHTSNCGKCHDGWKDCGGGNRVVFGKEFERLCHSPLMFIEPDTDALECVKTLLMILKK